MSISNVVSIVLGCVFLLVALRMFRGSDPRGLHYVEEGDEEHVVESERWAEELAPESDESRDLEEDLVSYAHRMQIIYPPSSSPRYKKQKIASCKKKKKNPAGEDGQVVEWSGEQDVWVAGNLSSCQTLFFFLHGLGEDITREGEKEISSSSSSLSVHHTHVWMRMLHSHMISSSSSFSSRFCVVLPTPSNPQHIWFTPNANQKMMTQNHEFHQSVAQIQCLLHTLAKPKKKKVILGGFSQGGAVASAAAVYHAQENDDLKVWALWIVGGYVALNIQQKEELKKNLTETKLRWVHGRKDQVVSWRGRGKTSVRWLIANGMEDFQVKMDEDCGHSMLCRKVVESLDEVIASSNE